MKLQESLVDDNLGRETLMAGDVDTGLQAVDAGLVVACHKTPHCPAIEVIDLDTLTGAQAQ